MGRPVAPLGQFIIKKGEWFRIIGFEGIVVWPVTYVVTVQSEFRGWDMEWRRYGFAWVPYWQGTFKEQERFTIYPGDLFLRVDVRSPHFDVGMNVETESSK